MRDSAAAAGEVWSELGRELARVHAVASNAGNRSILPPGPPRQAASRAADWLTTGRCALVRRSAPVCWPRLSGRHRLASSPPALRLLTLHGLSGGRILAGSAPGRRARTLMPSNRSAVARVPPHCHDTKTA